MTEFNFDKYTHILVVDLEATCCDLKSIPRHQMETIEIGAVMVERETLSIVDEFQTFIKPLRHPILTDFCLQLTSITQAQVDTAPTFPSVKISRKNISKTIIGCNSLFARLTDDLVNQELW